VQGRLTVPGVQQEGLCLDAAGDLWIADDRGSRVVRHAGALPALQAAPPAGPEKNGGGKKQKKG
jgi:hypothetical protein